MGVDRGEVDRLRGRSDHRQRPAIRAAELVARLHGNGVLAGIGVRMRACECKRQMVARRSEGERVADNKERARAAIDAISAAVAPVHADGFVVQRAAMFERGAKRVGGAGVGARLITGHCPGRTIGVERERWAHRGDTDGERPGLGVGL